MGDKSRPVLLIIGGGYLIYTGSRLISEVMESHPTSENLFIAFGAFFVLFGVLIVGVNLKKIYDLKKSEKESDVVVEDIDFSEAIEELPVRKEKSVKSNVRMVNLESEETGEEEAETEVEEVQSDEKESEVEDVYEEDVEEEVDDDEFMDAEEVDDTEPDDEEDEFIDAEEEFYEDDEEDDEEVEDESDEDLFKIKLERI